MLGRKRRVESVARRGVRREGGTKARFESESERNLEVYKECDVFLKEVISLCVSCWC